MGAMQAGTKLQRNWVMFVKQRTDEWVNLDENQITYHSKQWDEEKQSTLAFYEFIKHKLDATRCVLDLGAGAGAVTSYFARQAKGVSFVAADYVKDLLRLGQSLAHEERIQNLTFRQLDWFALKKSDEFDGVISTQVLTWLPELRTPLEQVFRNIAPKWFALTSLFYEGEISCTVEIIEHISGRKTFYNVYALPEVERVANEFGYRLTNFEKFEIPIDLPKPADKNLMSTYTTRVVDTSDQEERIQISGPLLMPWYMLLLERNDG